MTGNALFNSLGLGNVEADPNKIPDGTYDGDVMKSELVLVPAKARISHVITYIVTSGSKKGAQKQEWFEIATNPVDSNGQPAQKLSEVASATPSMTEQAKPWYKMRLTDLGGSDQEIDNGTFDLSSIVGTPCTFGVKTNEKGYQNVNFARKREVAATAAPVSLADLGATPAPVAAPTTAPTSEAPAPVEQAPQGLAPQAVTPAGL